MEQRKGTVYIVDDEPSVCEALAAVLETSGFNVRTFTSAQEFLDADHGDVPGCLLLDVRMPRMDGFALQRKLRARGITIPVVFVTGHGEASIAVQAMKEGAADFFEKPFESSGLIRSIRQILDEQDRPGTLTRFTKQLTGEEALELYRQITPRLVLALLVHLDEHADVRLVNRVVDHLCSPDVQDRMRRQRHVRDGIVDELRTALKDSRRDVDVSRDALLTVLEDTGVMKNLFAMEACLVHPSAA